MRALAGLSPHWQLTKLMRLARMIHVPLPVLVTLVAVKLEMVGTLGGYHMPAQKALRVRLAALRVRQAALRVRQAALRVRQAALRVTQAALLDDPSRVCVLRG